MLQQNSANLSTSLARLSSGSKITSPADDSAGLAVSMKLTAQIARTSAAQNNVNNAISFNQTQDGYLQQVNSALTRMSELAISAQDVTKTSSDLKLYDQEYKTLGVFINNVAQKTFNGVTLFNGATLTVTTDSEASSFSNLGVNLGSSAYSLATNSQLTSATYANVAMKATESAISQLASDRANIGSNEESLNYYSNALSTLSNNLSAANSQITDVDVATESTNYAKENILVQSATAMLAQANTMPQSVLRLIS